MIADLQLKTETFFTKNERSPFVRLVDNIANFNIRRPVFRWKVPIGGFLWKYNRWRFTIDVTAEGMIECSIQLLNVNKIQGKQNIFSTDKETMVDFKSSHK